MAIEGFDFKDFSETLSSQAEGLVPAEFLPFQKTYVVNTVKNFSMLSGEAIYNDETSKFTAEQAMLITQIIAEWSFHKSVDLIRSGILPDYWDGVMQKIAFTIFEIGKQAILNNLAQEEVLKVVEHHVKKTYQSALEELKSRKIIDQEIFNTALGQSNIDIMMQQLQEDEQNIQNTSEVIHANNNDNTKILKLATVALLLKQLPQDKVQIYLNKFEQEDAKTIIQYMQTQNLENKLDKDITMRCLQEIRINLPEPKNVNPDKIIAKLNNAYEKSTKDKIEKNIAKERPQVRELLAKAIDGESSQMPSKIANIIAQHLEENIS